MKNNEPITSNNSSSKHANKEIEWAVLGIIVVNNEYMDYVQNYLLEEDFYFLENRQFFSILKEINNKNETINEHRILNLAKEKNYTFLSPSYLSFLISHSGFSSSLDDYIQELVKLTGLRKIENGVQKILNDLNTNKNINDQTLITELNELVNSGYRSSNDKDFISAHEAANNYLKELEERRKNGDNILKGLSTGFQDIDKITSGLSNGELIVIAARPAMGKTAFALNIASNVSRKKHRVAFFSLEMNAKDLISRVISSITEIDGTKLKNPSTLSENEFYKLQATNNEIIKDMNLFIDDSSNNDLEAIKWKCRRLHKINPLSLIVIDYLQLISIKETKGDNRQNEVSKISRGLKVLARELNIPIITLSQLSRSVEQRENKKPLMSDLRESGAIEQDADIVTFLYRPDYYKKKEDPKSIEFGQEFGSPTFVIFSKHRNGATGSVILLFKMNNSLFKSVPEDWKEAIDKFKNIDGD